MPVRARLRTAPTGLLTVAAHAEPGGLAVVEGAAALPGLPVRRLRLSADADRLFLYGPDMATLVRYVTDELRADVRGELPVN
jgi:hypothetical protein